ncbi:MAG: TIGR03749 family integrating conjugative element protein [Gammaproteobacteria bacterium]|nr:TIGR03749 family integrating conjugative element protein [Gammaproteobacteria bacterium]
MLARLSLLWLVCITPAWGAPVAEGTEPPPPVNRVVWNKTPIPLRLTLNQERLVHFPAPVKIGVPSHLGAALSVQSVDGTVYLQTQTAFSPTRVQVQEIDSGRLYLLDVSADKHGGDNSPLTISAPRASATGSGTSALPPQDITSAEAQDPVDYVTLTRYAAQQLYAPARLIRDVPGIWPAQPPRQTPAPLVRGGAVEAIPIAAWRSRDYYLTAVRLRNLTDRPVILDPRHDLRGAWLSATPHHTRLLPRGDEADTTALYLISDRPFEENPPW